MIETTNPALDAATARLVASYHIAVCDGLVVQWLLDPPRAPQARRAANSSTRSAPTVVPQYDRGTTGR